MAEFNHIRASSALTPRKWADVLWADIPFNDNLPVILDAVQTSDFTRIFFPKHSSATIVEKAGAVVIDQSVKERSSIPNGYILDIPKTDSVEISSNGHTQVYQAQKINSDLFAGLNVLLVIAFDPDPELLKEWLQFNVPHSGANAVLLVRRMPPNKGKRHKLAKIKKVVEAAKGLKQFVLFDFDIPLGNPTDIAETHRLMVPDAPGKANLTRPENDIWRASLAQIGIYEAVRFRFLSEANVVCSCTLSDIITSTNENNLFDIAAGCATYLKIRSRFAYPWKLDTKNRTSLSDHCCTRFDSANGASIWFSRPKNEGYWRPFRTGVAPPSPLDKPANIWRCMATHYPNLQVAEIVPKSSLVYDRRLTNALKRRLDANPELPPPPEKPPENLKNDKFLIVTTMKDEGPFILEWLAYHRSIGATDFLVYTNDCSDGTDEMFDLLAAKGYLEHRENPYREVDMKPQHAAYLDASKSELAKNADWVMCMDVDEYINIHVGDGMLSDLFKAVGSANIISLTWRLFGNAKITDFEDKFITEQFFQAAPQFVRKPHQAWGFKTMFRPLGYYKKFGVHRPKGLRPEALQQIKWVNGSGHPMPPDILRTGWRCTSRNWGYALATLNHYSLRSAESFLVKRYRGRVNHVDRDQGMNYWFRMNNNATEDRSILDKLPKAKAEFNKMMADPEIRDMHDRCVKSHKERISQLLDTDDYRKLFTEITGDRMNRLSEMHHHLGAMTFLEGPDCIPDTFHLEHKTFCEDQPDYPESPAAFIEPFFK